MRNQIEKLNPIYDAHKGRFDSGFHNMLWEVMVNGSLDGSPAEYAFTCLHDGMMVIAATDGGYLKGCHCRIKDAATHEDAHEAAQDLCEELTLQVFGHDKDAGMRIICKSLGNQTPGGHIPARDPDAEDDTSALGN